MLLLILSGVSSERLDKLREELEIDNRGIPDQAYVQKKLLLAWQDLR